jgi:SSS family solute:Na+ symporter
VITPRYLSFLDYIIIALYFGLTLGVGWWCVRRKKQSSTDYFLGGGRVAWWALALSMFATGTSSISFMALPAKTYQSDWLAFGSAPAQAFAGVVVGLVFVNMLRRLNLTTVYGYLDRRFDARVRLLGAALAVLLKVGGRMSVVMLLPALALSTVTGMNVYLSIVLIGGVTTFYAMEGGFEAVVWTDVLQAIVAFFSLGIALCYLTNGVPGGFGGIVDLANAAGKMRAIDTSVDLTQPTIWVFFGMFLAAIFTQLGDQPNMQRWFAISDDRETRRTVAMSTVIGLTAATVFFFIGTALHAFYKSNPARLATGLSNDAIFPFFIANELPPGVVGFIVAGLFASAMGALSSAINSTAAVIVSDFHHVFAPQATEAARLRMARLATLVCGGIATAMASYLAFKNVLSLWDEFLKLVALIGGGFPGVFALGLISRRATAPGVMIGALGSIAITWWVQNFTKTSVFLHGFVAVASCMAIGYGASLLFGRRRSIEELEGLTLWQFWSKRSRAPATTSASEFNDV